MPLYVMRWHIGPLPTTLLEAEILVTVAAYVIAALRGAAPWPKRTPYEIPIVLLLVAGLIGIAVAPDHRGALGIFRAYLLEPIAIYYVATAVLATGESIESILATWGVGAVVFAVVEMTTFARALAEHRLVLGHAAAAFGINPNSVAIYLEPLIAIAAGFALFDSGSRRRLGIAVLAVLLVAEAATLSRGGLLALAALAVIAFITVRAVLFRGVLLAGAVAGALVLWQLPFVGLRIKYFLVDPAHTLFGRFHIWSATLRMLRDHPVFGAGLNAYQTAMAPYRAADAYQVAEPYPHNIVLTTWTELGLLGLAAFVYILAAVIIRPWRALARSSGPSRAVLWGLGSAFIMIAVHGLTDSPYWKNDLSLEFWVLAAIEVVALRALSSSQVHDG